MKGLSIGRSNIIELRGYNMRHDQRLPVDTFFKIIKSSKHHEEHDETSKQSRRFIKALSMDEFIDIYGFNSKDLEK
jgi:hypothetical protein